MPYFEENIKKSIYLISFKCWNYSIPSYSPMQENLYKNNYKILNYYSNFAEQILGRERSGEILVWNACNVVSSSKLHTSYLLLGSRHTWNDK